MVKDHRASQQGSSAGLSILRRKILAAPAAMVLSRAVHAQEAPRLPKPPPKGQIVVGFTQEPTVFNPLFARVEVDQAIWLALFNALWRSEPDGTFVPELAVEVPTLENGGISADGLSWNITLRKGVQWHDGVEFTAEDVKYTFDLLNNPSFRAGSRQGHALVRDITVQGRYQISWKMAKAYAPYLALLTWTFMVPKHILGAAADPNTAPFNEAPVGTGPFKWSKRIAGQGVTVEANPNYFGDGPHVERVMFNYIPDSNALYTQFQTGQIDYAGYYGIPAHFYQEAAKLRDRHIYKTNYPQIEGIVMNFGRPFFQEKAVRQAMYLGLNKEVMIDLVYYGIPTVAESFLPKSSWAFNPDLPKHVFDLAASSKVLDEAGWVLASDGVRTKGGVRLEFTVATVSGVPERLQMLQLIQQDWHKIGIAIQIKTMASAVVWGDYYTKSQFDCLIAATNYGTGSDPDPTSRLSSAAIPAQGGSGANYWQYKNPQVDRLLQVGQTSFKREDRKAAYWQIQSLIRDDLAFLPICNPSPVEGTKVKLIGFRPTPNYSCDCWNMGSWHWDA